MICSSALSRTQHRALLRIQEAQRLLYNAALEERVEAWRKARKSITRIDQYISLTQIRADDPQGYGALPIAASRWATDARIVRWRFIGT